jgi:hypothetical protein
MTQLIGDVCPLCWIPPLAHRAPDARPAKRPPKRTSAAEVAEIMRRHAAGHSPARIAAALGRAYSTVCMILGDQHQRRVRVPVDKAETRRIIAAYGRPGATVKTLAPVFCRDQATIAAVLRDAGVLRSVGGDRKTRRSS